MPNKVTISDVLDDISDLRTKGYIPRGIEMGMDAWDDINLSLFPRGVTCDSMSNCFIAPERGVKPSPGCELLGLPLTVAESLEHKIFYLVEPRSVRLVSRESLRKDAEHEPAK